MAQLKKKQLRAIDLYSGIGGWSLGLKMAGVNVVASYEWWDKASLTNRRNNGHIAVSGDIRELKIESLPSDIQVVVGSPPCTQFSFANRGGGGDIEDGLRDIEKFLEIVEHLKPKFWAMENVPRVAKILEARLQAGETFHRFAKLRPVIKVVDMSEWGLPQARNRCIVGNIDFGLLDEYRKVLPKRTLGNVIDALAKDSVVDPIYGIRRRKDNISDHLVEAALSDEEQRINREMKSHHPVYNNMSFPDSPERPSRTITATCTRVSRESVVISAPETPNKFRRLTVRERASLQGFPITYRFYGESYSDKLKMVGNAIPPLFTFYVAQALTGVPAHLLIHPREGIKEFVPPTIESPRTSPDRVADSFSAHRRFRMAIPNLRFKSGVRFELSNGGKSSDPDWRVRFFFGNSKNIQEVTLDGVLLRELLRHKDLSQVRHDIERASLPVSEIAARVSSDSLQSMWSRSNQAGVHPFDVVDILGETTLNLVELFDSSMIDCNAVVRLHLEGEEEVIGLKKVLANAPYVLAGFILGATVNDILKTRGVRRQAA